MAFLGHSFLQCNRNNPFSMHWNPEWQRNTYKSAIIIHWGFSVPYSWQSVREQKSVGFLTTRNIYNLLQYWNPVMVATSIWRHHIFPICQQPWKPFLFLFSQAGKDAERVKRKSGGTQEENRRIWFPWQPLLWGSQRWHLSRHSLRPKCVLKIRNNSCNGAEFPTAPPPFKCCSHKSLPFPPLKTNNNKKLLHFFESKIKNQNCQKTSEATEKNTQPK